MADRVTDELRYQYDCLLQQKEPCLVLTGGKINEVETPDSLKTTIIKSIKSVPDPERVAESDAVQKNTEIIIN